MPVTNRKGGKTGLGKALMTVGVPVCFIDPKLGVGITGLGAIIYAVESSRDQNNNTQKEIKKEETPKIRRERG